MEKGNGRKSYPSDLTDEQWAEIEPLYSGMRNYTWSKRWVVERTLAWLNHSRRLSKDVEISAASAEALVKISHAHTLLKRL